LGVDSFLFLRFERFVPVLCFENGLKRLLNRLWKWKFCSGLEEVMAKWKERLVGDVRDVRCESRVWIASD